MKDKKKDLIVKVPLAKLGKWWNARFGLISFTFEDFQDIIKNFKDNILGFTPYLTFGHLSEEHNSTDSHRKKGDLFDLKVVGNTLFGYFKVKPLTYRFIQDEEYEFSSIEYQKEGHNKENNQPVGKLLERVGLTNSPFVPFSGSKAIALSNNLPDVGNKFCVASTISVEKISGHNYNFNNIPNKKTLTMNKKSVIDSGNVSPTIDVEALTAAVSNRIKAEVSREINALRTQLEQKSAECADLSGKLNETKKIARQRASQLLETKNAMGQTIQSNFATHLLSQGITKTAVDKCLLLLDAHAKQSNTVRLSNSEGEVKTVGVAELLNDIISDISSNNVSLSQSGAVNSAPTNFDFGEGFIDGEIARLQQGKRQ